MYTSISNYYAHSNFCTTVYDVFSSVEVLEDTIYMLVPLIHF